MGKTLHGFIMREAASTGQPKVKLTPAQRRYLKAVQTGDITTSWGYVNSAPHGINMRTHNICEHAGWVAVAAGAHGDRKPVTITPDGRAALAEQRP